MAREELGRLEQSRAISSQREQQMAGYSNRIKQLESELARNNQTALNQQEFLALKQEREDLLKHNADLQRQQPNAAQSQEKLAELR